MTPVDPIAIPMALERQLALLTPVVEHLHLAATGRSPLPADEWRGPAAEAARRFEGELRSCLRAAEDAAADTVRRLHVMARAVS